MPPVVVLTPLRSAARADLRQPRSPAITPLIVSGPPVADIQRAVGADRHAAVLLTGAAPVYTSVPPLSTRFADALVDAPRSR
jgi:hypothetical protein